MVLLALAAVPTLDLGTVDVGRTAEVVRILRPAPAGTRFEVLSNAVEIRELRREGDALRLVLRVVGTDRPSAEVRTPLAETSGAEMVTVADLRYAVRAPFDAAASLLSGSSTPVRGEAVLGRVSPGWAARLESGRLFVSSRGSAAGHLTLKTRDGRFTRVVALWNARALRVSASVESRESGPIRTTIPLAVGDPLRVAVNLRTDPATSVRLVARSKNGLVVEVAPPLATPGYGDVGVTVTAVKGHRPLGATTLRWPRPSPR